MASAPAAKPRTSYAEYLAAEEKSATKHEWLDGVVYADPLAGARDGTSGDRSRGWMPVDVLYLSRDEAFALSHVSVPFCGNTHSSKSDTGTPGMRSMRKPVNASSRGS